FSSPAKPANYGPSRPCSPRPSRYRGTKNRFRPHWPPVAKPLKHGLPSARMLRSGRLYRRTHRRPLYACPGLLGWVGALLKILERNELEDRVEWFLERGIRKRGTLTLSVSCRFLVAAHAQIAVFASAAWPVLAHSLWLRQSR